MVDKHTALLKAKILEQEKVYRALKNGDTSSVQYSETYDKKWGTSDVNDKNRMRLAYYLLYEKTDDETAVAYLFEEELKDRKSNSFQGIGNTLNVLTFLLGQYNVGGKYDGLFEEAKNANFDCACGYDRDFQISSDMESLDLLDCIFLSQDLDYKDVMEILVDRWKDTVEEWTDSERMTLTRFHSFLGREQENEAVYRELLANAVSSGKVFDAVSAYNKVIRFYIDAGQFETAYTYLKRMTDTTDFEEIERIRLFGDVLEECFEIICGFPAVSDVLWHWSKPRFMERKNRYGNLYTKAIEAAKTVGDPDCRRIEGEYLEWKKQVGLK